MTRYVHLDDNKKKKHRTFRRWSPRAIKQCHPVLTLCSPLDLVLTVLEKGVDAQKETPDWTLMPASALRRQPTARTLVDSFPVLHTRASSGLLPSTESTARSSSTEHHLPHVVQAVPGQRLGRARVDDDGASAGAG
jgi:hypothetical protein